MNQLDSRSDTLFNLLLSTKSMHMAAGVVYFHHKGVFDPARRDVANPRGKERRKKRCGAEPPNNNHNLGCCLVERKLLALI